MVLLADHRSVTSKIKSKKKSMFGLNKTMIFLYSQKKQCTKFKKAENNWTKQTPLKQAHQLRFKMTAQ